jgi:uncharacterized membrane protein
MERRTEPTRLEGFSDAVFGFALTLLVVALDVPEDVAGLVELLKGFLPFALTFAMICWIWYEHQQFYRNYDLEDPWIITVNCFLLFVILFYVYPLKFLTVGLVGPITHMTKVPKDFRQHSEIVMLAYSSGVVLVFGAFVLMYQHAWRMREKLKLTADELVTLRFAKRGHQLSTALGVASLALLGIGWLADTDLMPMFAGIIYGLMGPLHAVNGYQAGKAHAQLKKAAAAPPPQETHAKR